MQAVGRLAERNDAAMAMETDLVREAQAGERAAFDRLVTTHATAVLRSAYVIVGNREEAEDVAQETFIAAYRNLHTYQPTAPFGAWLHRIAVNRSYDYIRRRQRQQGLVDEIAAGSPVSEDDRAQQQARHNELSQEVRELIAGLDESNRAIVSLRFLQDMPIKEIAATLEMPEGTVKRRLHEVLKKLRSSMSEEALQ